MPTTIRMQVTVYKSGDLPADYITNTFYLLHQQVDPLSDTDWDALTNDTANLWAQFRPYPEGWGNITVKAYNMNDSVPRRPKSTKDLTHNNTNSSQNGPREVACCLSFSTAKNLPRERGRLYIGPWGQSQMDERPGTNVRSQLAFLSVGLQDLGGVNVDWSIHSVTGASETHSVERWWVDDEWDTQRRRGLDPTMRLEGTTSENSP